MEILIILAVILIVIIAKFGSMKDKIDVLRRSNSSLSESLTKARQECDSVRAKLAQKTRESEAALAQKTRESNAIIARKNREHNELARTLESVRADNTNMC